MAEYTLYCFAQSGNAYKPALMLALNRADWEPRFVDFFAGETRSPEYRTKVNEMGEAPVLEHAGKRLAQSGVILDYLVERFGTNGWANEDERREILRWILFDNHKVSGQAAPLRFLRALMKTGETPVTEFLHARLVNALKILNGHLTAREFVLGAKPTIADLSLCGYLFWPDEIGVTYDDYPRIAAWLGRIRGLDGWVDPYELMPGHPLPEKPA